MMTWLSFEEAQWTEKKEDLNLNFSLPNKSLHEQDLPSCVSLSAFKTTAVAAWTHWYNTQEVQGTALSTFHMLTDLTLQNFYEVSISILLIVEVKKLRWERSCNISDGARVRLQMCLNHNS